VLRLVVGEGAFLAAAGIAAGVAVSLVVTRLAASLLFGVGATDPVTFVGVPAVLAAAALAASYLPARRAMRLDPSIALRRE
jgi:putative ABC transport system permease protein